MMDTSGSIFVFCALFFACAPLQAGADSPTYREEIEELLPQVRGAQLEELLEAGELVHIISPEEGPTLIPGTGFTQNIKKDFEAIDYKIGVEVLNIIPRPKDELSAIEAANLLLELSTLEGLEYYSASRDTMRTLFVQSYAIDGPETGNRIEDPVVDEIPADGRGTLFQEDKTFGKNKLAITYRVTPLTIHLMTENITRFSWGLIPLIKPGRMHMHIVIHMGENFILYYGNVGAKALRIRALEKRISDSFYNRLVALQGWFEGKLDTF